MDTVYFGCMCSVIKDMFVRMSSFQMYDTRSRLYNFHLNHASYKIRILFFAFHGVVLWNSLLND